MMHRFKYSVELQMQKKKEEKKNQEIVVPLGAVSCIIDGAHLWVNITLLNWVTSQ